MAIASDPAVYTVADVCRVLQIDRSVFYRARARGDLQFVVEALPRIGPRSKRYLRKPIDEWAARNWRPNDGRRRRHFPKRGAA